MSIFKSISESLDRHNANTLSKIISGRNMAISAPGMHEIMLKYDIYTQYYDERSDSFCIPIDVLAKNKQYKPLYLSLVEQEKQSRLFSYMYMEKGDEFCIVPNKKYNRPNRELSDWETTSVERSIRKAGKFESKELFESKEKILKILKDKHNLDEKDLSKKNVSIEHEMKTYPQAGINQLASFIAAKANL